MSVAFLAGIGMFRWPFRPYQFPNWCESSRVGANKKKKKKKGRVDELDAVSGRVGLRCGDLGAVSVLSSLGSTDTAGRVLHWILMRPDAGCGH